jgi:phage shock protein E
MNGTLLLAVAGVVAAVFLWKKSGQISAQAAREYLKNGARVIDVRSPGEFRSGHLAGAVNIPLEEIETAILQRVKDRNQVLLLHCASGVRSGLACRKLKRLGFAQVYNLGSYGRAEKILGSRR